VVVGQIDTGEAVVVVESEISSGCSGM
jgi:hypothetical protein